MSSKAKESVQELIEACKVAIKNPAAKEALKADQDLLSKQKERDTQNNVIQLDKLRKHFDALFPGRGSAP